MSANGCEATLRHKRPMAGPSRQYQRALQPTGRMDVHDGRALIAIILQRMRNQRHKTGAGSYVLGDPQGWIYVLAEGESTTAAVLRGREDWLVGLYSVPPSAEQMLGDLQEHYAHLVPAVLYGAIRAVEG